MPDQAWKIIDRLKVRSIMKKIYYGWFVLGGLFVLMMVSIGITVNSFSLFYKPVVTALGFTYGEFSLTSSVAALCAMFGCIIVAKLMQKVDLRVIVTVSTVIYAISILLDGFARTLTQFYILAAFTGFGYAGIGGVAVSQVVTNWFKEKQGLAMAVAMAGSGVGGLIFSPLINTLILAFGWQITFFILAAIILVITLPFSIFVIRLSPEQKGLKAFGEKRDDQGLKVEEDGVTLSLAAKNGRFWALCLTNFIAGLLVMGVQMHAPVFIQTVGLSSSLAAAVMAVSSVVLIPGKLLHGYIHDKFGAKVSTFYIFGAFFITLVSLIILRDLATSMLYGVLFGLSGAITTVALPLWTVTVFGKKDYAMIFSIMSMAMTLGAAIGSPLAGFIYDSAKSYIPAWVLLIAITVVGLIITLIAVGSKKVVSASNQQVGSSTDN